MTVFVIGCAEGQAEEIKKAILDTGSIYVQTFDPKSTARTVSDSDLVVMDGDTLRRLVDSDRAQLAESKISETLSVVARCNENIRGLLNARQLVG